MFATLRLCIRIPTLLSFVIWGDIICIYGMLVFAFLACDVKGGFGSLCDKGLA